MVAVPVNRQPFHTTRESLHAYIDGCANGIVHRRELAPLPTCASSSRPRKTPRSSAAKVHEYLGTTDPDVRTLLGKQSPQEIAAAVVAGTRLGEAPLRAQLLAGGAAAIDAYHDPLDAPARAVRADYENSVKAVQAGSRRT